MIKIIKSSYQLNLLSPIAKPCPLMPCPHVLNTSRAWGLCLCPGQPVPTIGSSLIEEILPDIQSEPPIAELETVSSWPITGHVRKKATSSSITPFQGFLESKEVSPQPSHLQTKEAQFPQSLLIKLCFLVPSLALLLFSVPAWATQYPLCSEELLTDCTTQGSV